MRLFSAYNLCVPWLSGMLEVQEELRMTEAQEERVLELREGSLSWLIKSQELRTQAYDQLGRETIMMAVVGGCPSASACRALSAGRQCFPDGSWMLQGRSHIPRHACLPCTVMSCS